MAIETVKTYLKKYGRDNDILEFPTSSATVAMAAQALNVENARIAKTLAFRYDDSCILVVTAGDTKIDNAKFKQTFNIKANMLSPDEVFKFTGHVVGGVCPFALTDANIKIFMDESLKRFKTVFPACGSSNSAIELTIQDLFNYSNCEGWVNVCKILEEN